MATPTFFTGFEPELVAAVPGTGVPTTAQYWNQITGTPTVETSIVHHGAAAIRFTAVANQQNVVITYAAGARRKVISVYVRFQSLPTGGTCRIITLPTATSPYYVGVDTGGKWVAVANGGSVVTDSAGPSVDEWYRIDLDADGTGQTLSWQIDGVAKTQATGSAGAADLTVLRIGPGTNTTADLILDCLVQSDTAGDYPLGEYVVKGYRPNNDDDITQVGAGSFVDAAAAAISGSNPAWDNLLDMSDASTTRVEQTVNAGTGYIEVGFEDSDEAVVPQWVMAIASMRADTTAAAKGQVQVDDGGTLDAFTGLIDPSEATNVTAWEILTTKPSGGAWTKAAFDALAMRFGYSTDANPDVWFVGMMFEVAFPTAPVEVTQADEQGTWWGAFFFDEDRDYLYYDSTPTLDVTAAFSPPPVVAGDEMFAGYDAVMDFSLDIAAFWPVPDLIAEMDAAALDVSWMDVFGAVAPSDPIEVTLASDEAMVGALDLAAFWPEPDMIAEASVATTLEPIAVFAPIVTKNNTFEGGTPGVTISTGNSGGASGDAFDSVRVGSQPQIFSADQPAVGAVGMENLFNAGVSSFTDVIWRHAVSGEQLTFGRAYVYRTTNLKTHWAGIGNVGGEMALFSVSADGFVQITRDSGTTALATGVVELPYEQHVRLEFRVSWNPGVGGTGDAQIRVYLDPNAAVDAFDEEITYTYTGVETLGTSPIRNVRFGFENATSGPQAMYLDNVGMSNGGGWLGPLGTVTTPQKVAPSYVANHYTGVTPDYPYEYFDEALDFNAVGDISILIPPVVAADDSYIATLDLAQDMEVHFPPDLSDYQSTYDDAAHVLFNEGPLFPDDLLGVLALPDDQAWSFPAPDYSVDQPLVDTAIDAILSDGPVADAVNFAQPVMWPDHEALFPERDYTDETPFLDYVGPLFNEGPLFPDDLLGVLDPPWDQADFTPWDYSNDQPLTDTGVDAVIAGPPTFAPDEILAAQPLMFADLEVLFPLPDYSVDQPLVDTAIDAILSDGPLFPDDLLGVLPFPQDTADFTESWWDPQAFVDGAVEAVLAGGLPIELFPAAPDAPWLWDEQGLYDVSYDGVAEYLGLVTDDAYIATLYLADQTAFDETWTDAQALIAGIEEYLALVVTPIEQLAGALDPGPDQMGSFVPEAWAWDYGTFPMGQTDHLFAAEPPPVGTTPGVPFDPSIDRRRKLHRELVGVTRIRRRRRLG